MQLFVTNKIKIFGVFFLADFKKKTKKIYSIDVNSFILID